MKINANFLCEIGTEEIPAGYIPPAISGIRDMFSQSLTEQRIDFSEINVYATPRRFAVLIDELAEEQREEEIELKGPSLKAAYDENGKPCKALEGFLKGNGLGMDDIYQVETEKGIYIYGRKKLKSEKTVEILPEIITAVIQNISFPKRMRWSDKSISFPRPISYFVLLFNDKIVPFEIDGIVSSNITRGHYIQANESIEIKSTKDYISLLKKHNVILNHEERKKLIREKLNSEAETLGGKVYEDEDLLDTVTFLVESPHVASCVFNPSFLSIPEVCLIAEMKEHQKYFAVHNKEGKLMNKFLVVSNNPVTDHIVAGNVRVISARFSDANFFFEEDRKHRLVDKVDSLKSVLFHRELGSIYDKIERMRMSGRVLCGELSLNKETFEKADRAILLSKADLNTAMVFEFTSLQGKIGGIYARLDGEDDEVAAAIEEHYKPSFQGDRLPSNSVSIVASLAEKIDNIMGSFSVGNVPKGSQDPYALRRQAHAVVDILIENELNCDIRTVLQKVAPSYKDGESCVEPVIDFISNRARTIFQDKGLIYDEIDACFSLKQSDYLELYRRASSIHEFRKRENFSQMLLSFKRMNNILSAFRKSNPDYSLELDETRLEYDEEKALRDFFLERSNTIREYIKESKYIDLFELLINGKSCIDAFFDNVLVMAEDTVLRDNRLYILESILSNFVFLMDFSKITDQAR